MKLPFRFLVILVFACAGQMRAQDIHFSQFYLSPLSLNPANTGAFFGSIRIGGIYRGQNYNSPGNFRTPLFYGDAPLKGLRKQDWVGLGVTMFQDKAGIANLTQSGLYGSAAYHLGLSSKNNTVLTLGVQAGTLQTKLGDKNGLDFSDNLLKTGNYKTGQQSADFSRVTDQTQRGLDINAGMMLKTKLNKTMDMNLGFSVRHITKPKYSVKAGSSADNLGKRPMGFVLHGQFNMDFTKQLSLSPMFLYQTTAKTNEAAVQALAGYKLKPEDEMKLNFGLGYRLTDAAQVLLGVDWGDLRVGLCYDITTSSLSNVNGGQGAFEIGLMWITKIYKKPDLKPVIFCPRF